MNSSARKQHRFLILGLMFLLPVIAAMGIFHRKAPVLMDALPAVFAEAIALPQNNGNVVWEKKNLWSDYPAIHTQLLKEEDTLKVELAFEKPLLAPDILAYWSHEPISPEGSLGQDVVLLGSVRDVKKQRFVLPQSATQNSGHLIFYSLGHHRVLTSAAIQTN